MSAEYPYSELTKKIIGFAIKVHRILGPGFVEKIYQRALYLELKCAFFVLEREKKINVTYGPIHIGYTKADFIVDNKIILELKAVSEIKDLHRAQLISYLKATGLEVGLLLNFAKPVLEIKRLVNTINNKQ